MPEPPDLNLDDEQMSAIRRLESILREAADLLPRAFGLSPGPFPPMPLYEGQTAEEVRAEIELKAESGKSA